MSLKCSDKFTIRLNQRTIDPNTENIKPWLIDITLRLKGGLVQNEHFSDSSTGHLNAKPNRFQTRAVTPS